MTQIPQAELQALYEPSSYDSGVPLELLKRCRDQAAVVWIDEQPTSNWPGGKGYWLVTRHAEVEQVLRTPKVFSSHLGGTQLRDPATESDLQFVRQMMLNMDPPEHSRLRRLLSKSFTPSAVRKLETQIQENAQGIVDRAIERFPDGYCDFAIDIAADMPLLTLADLLGMPREDRYLMFDWANRVIGFLDPDYADSASFEKTTGSRLAQAVQPLRPQPDSDGKLPDPRSRNGMPDLYRYAHLLAEQKRADPQDDIVSILLQQVDDIDGRMSITEFENMFWLFVVAGNETLRNGIPGGMIALLENPTSLTECLHNPALIDNAADEMLRWWTPVMIFRRTVTEDTVLASTKINAGDKIVVSFTSANRDERVFSNPDRFDIHRDAKAQLAMGYGPHYCLGAELGKVQIRALFKAFLSRVKSVESAGEPRFLRSNFQRGVKSLPIRFVAR